MAAADGALKAEAVSTGEGRGGVAFGHTESSVHSEGSTEASERPGAAVGTQSRGGTQDIELRRIRPPRAPNIAPAVQAKLPSVLDDLMSLLLHACHGVAWSARIGGIAGLEIVSKRLPAEYLKPWSPQIVAAVANVLSGLPDHSTTERVTVTQLLREVVLKTVGLAPGREARGEAAVDAHMHDSEAAANLLLVWFLLTSVCAACYSLLG